MVDGQPVNQLLELLHFLLRDFNLALQGDRLTLLGRFRLPEVSDGRLALLERVGL